jgi:hypothetical protein
VRLMGRTRLQYRDGEHDLSLFAEAGGKPWSQIAVDTSSIPESDELPRDEVVGRLKRAFEFAGWTFIDPSRNGKDER